MTRSRAQNKNLQVQQTLIDWRRSQIIQLIHKGKTLNEIAEILQLDRSTISRDYQCIKDNSADVMSKYLLRPNLGSYEVLARINAVSDEA